MVKAAPMLDIKSAILDLAYIHKIYVVAVKNDVKELLFILRKPSNHDPEINCVNLTQKGTRTFAFKYSDEEQLAAPVSNAGKFLLDPDNTIMKAGGFKSIAHRWNLSKISVSTHLYLSKEMVSDFPGRVFRIIEINPAKKVLKRLKYLNVVVKNAPVKPEDLLKRYQCIDGGTKFLFCFRDQNNAVTSILAELEEFNR